MEKTLISVFRTNLQSYFKIATLGMKQSTLQQHKEVVMLCEKGMTTAEARSALSTTEYKIGNTN
jgi:hypothetical protein